MEFYAIKFWGNMLHSSINCDSVPCQLNINFPILWLAFLFCFSNLKKITFDVQHCVSLRYTIY